MKYKNAFFVILSLSLLCGTSSRAADPQLVDDLSQASLESDFQAEDSRNLATESALEKQEEKQTERQIANAKRKSEQLKSKNERVAADLQSQSKRLEDSKQVLATEESKVEKLNIDLVNNSKELDRVRAENNDLKIKVAQARAQEAKIRRDLAQVERQRAIAAKTRAALLKSKKSVHVVRKHKVTKAKKVALR